MEELTSRLETTLTRGNGGPAAVELRVNARASPRRHQTNRTLSDSAAIISTCGEGDRGRGEEFPPIPPPRVKVEKKHKQGDNNSPPRVTSNGLPPTPKVHMGACFMKVRICIH